MQGVDTAKVVLITQAGQGFGRAVALAYGQAGYDIVCADRDVDRAARTAAEIESLGGQAIPIQADPTSALDVQVAFSKVLEIFGSLSGVVHTTNADAGTPFQSVGEGELIELFDETVRSSVLVLRAAQRAAPGCWVVVVAPPPQRERPHLAAAGGALARLAHAFPTPSMNTAEDDPFAPEATFTPGLRVNVVVPSRTAADPIHDAALVNTVRMLGSAAGAGIHGAEIPVLLPPPPEVVETLLPEVQAALDDTLRQFDDDFAPASERMDVDGELFDALMDEALDERALSMADENVRRLVMLEDDEANDAFADVQVRVERRGL